MFSKPLIAVVKNMYSKEEFDEQKLEGLCLEVIGGNHRREAICQLAKEGKLKENPLMHTMVLLYAGISRILKIKEARRALVLNFFFHFVLNWSHN